MNRTHVFAYTGPGSDYPPYANLSRCTNGYRLTVRSQGDGGRNTASIDLAPDVVEALADRALDDLNRKRSAPVVTEDMVARFLTWKLPPDFWPDGNVCFNDAAARAGSWPVGTNLLTAVQARAMLEHVLGVPAAEPDFLAGARACDLSGDKPCDACQ